MIIAEKMQDSMNEQLIEPAPRADAAILRLPGSGIRRNHHIAQKVGGDMGKFTLPHGKSNYIGRPVSIEILLIELFDLRIVYDENGYFSIRKFQGA